MFLLCKSKNESLIEALEDYYISKYIDHPQNDNIKAGSAGKAKAIKGEYYLYVVVTEKKKRTGKKIDKKARIIAGKNLFCLG